MLSSVSKIADKPFIIGFLLPALIFAVVLPLLFHIPDRLAFLFPRKQDTNPFADLTFFALAVWVIATFLLRFNYLTYRVLEGYTAPMAWFGWCKQYHQNRLKRLQDEADAVKASGDIDRATKLRELWLAQYPSNAKWVLPTTFGNAIRSFETYSYDIYRADLIVLWSRLAAVVPKEYMAQIDNARCQADFLVSLCLLGWIVAAIALGDLIGEVSQLGFRAFPDDALRLAYVMAGALFASWVFYRWSIQALRPWGETIKAMSDCYLPALATQLGYVLPDQETERRQFWRTIVKRMVFRREFPKTFNPIVPAPETAPSKQGAEDAAAVKKIQSGILLTLARCFVWALFFVIHRRRDQRGKVHGPD